MIMRLVTVSLVCAAMVAAVTAQVRPDRSKPPALGATRQMLFPGTAWKVT